MQTIDLRGKWKFKGIDAYKTLPSDKRSVRQWMTASVPGTVHLDLMANRKIPDPFYRTNENDVQWIDKQNWLYRREFAVGRDFLREDRIELVAEGLDTYARIHCNGRFVGETQNMFVTHRFDLKKYLVPGRNSLQILFDSPVVRSKKAERRYGPLEVALNSYRVYVRKAQYSFGWDWGPTLATSGIWRPLYLEGVSGGTLSNPFVKVLSIKNDEAIVEASADVERFSKGSFVVCLAVEGQDFSKEMMLPVKGREVKRRIRIPHPQLWWPNGRGEQPLYKAVFRLLQGEEECCRVETSFGIRTVRLRQDPDGDGASFVIEVNGEKIFCKGADWIPSDSFLPRNTGEKYSALLQMAKDAHMNMLRVWGGGVYEDKEFYDLCDRLGLMVWQDFMFACGEYPEELWFLREVSTEAQKTVKDLRNHPSIVLWCGNNECEWLYCTQDPDRSPDRMCGAKIFRDVLPTVCREEDGTRPYWRSSPYGKGLPNDESNGNHHQWSVWSLWRDYPEYEKSKARFVTEFGFQAPANERTFESVTLPEDRHPQSKVFEHYNKQVGGVERLFRFLAGHMGVETDFGDFIYKTQLLQAEALKTAVEHWRRRKFKTAGALFWQLNDCWPVSSWSVVDSALFPKAAYYYAKKFFAPVLVSFRKRSNTIEVWGTNDKPARVAGAADIRLRSFDGAEEDVRKFDVILPANTSKKLCSIGLTELTASPPTTSYLLAQFRTDGEVLSSNRFFFVEPKHMHLPSQRINTELSALGENRYLLELRTPTFAKNVRVFVEREDAQFEDNFFDIDAGIPKRIVVTFCGSMDQLRAELTLKAMTGLSTHESIAKDTVL